MNIFLIILLQIWTNKNQTFSFSKMVVFPESTNDQYDKIV
jgi:hypothetical protein